MRSRAASVPELEPVEDDFPTEPPTAPGSKQGSLLYDRDLHELVGRLMQHAVKQSARVRSLRSELRELRLDVRRLSRRQTLQLGGAVVVFEVAQRLLERFGG